MSIFGPENTCIISREEMYEMNPNVFSIANDTVIIDSTFKRLQGWLNRRNVKTIPIPYREVSKLGGLLRCTTQPLERVY